MTRLDLAIMALSMWTTWQHTVSAFIHSRAFIVGSMGGLLL